MLRNIPAILSPDLLMILRAMGHGDEIVIADANFPSTSMGQREVLEAVLRIMPLDAFVDDPAQTMQVVGNPSAVPEIVARFQEIVDNEADNPAQIRTLERFAFYERAKAAYAIVQTGETRLYGNIILKKGIIKPV